jgi:hypothetical protein
MTNLGRAKEAAAMANATTIEITHIAIGDGATVPSGGETALYNQVALKTISGHGTVVGADNVAYFDCYLAAGDGPYTIREAGLYDVDGDLIAIAHYDPPLNKPVPESGQTVEGMVRLEVAFSNVANVTISVDPSMQVALQRLSRLPWIPIISMTLATPPGSPTPGDAYLIAASPTGSWTGQAGKIAEYTAAGWAIMTPPDGHGVSLPDGRVFERISGAYVEKIALDAQSGKWVYAADSGSVNALAVTLVPVPTAYVAGQTLRIKAANSNTGATTLNVNSLGAKSVIRRDGSALLDSDIMSGAVQEYIYDGTNFQLASAFGRAALVRNVDLYVNGSIGNDANDGTANTSGKALATIQKAVDIAFGYPPSQFTITIHVADGTYTGAVATPSYGGPNIAIDGNSTTPANVVVSNSAAGAHCFSVQGPNTVTVKNLKVQNSGTGGSGGFVASNGGMLTTMNTVNGAISGPVWEGFGGGQIIIAGNHVHAGGFGTGVMAIFGGQVQIASSLSITISTPVTAGTAYAYTTSHGGIFLNAPNAVWSGSTVTGTRYLAGLNSVISVNGAGVNVFPGTVAGSTASGGQYA